MISSRVTNEVLQSAGSIKNINESLANLDSMRFSVGSHRKVAAPIIDYSQNIMSSSGNPDRKNTNIQKGSVDMTSARDHRNMLKPPATSKGLVGKKNRPQTAGRYNKNHHSTAPAGAQAQ